MTTPPAPLTGTLLSSEGCASVANSAGNLLFYTDGDTIWNQTHSVMANGTGLLGHKSTTQSALIVKQPGNTNIYFVFTLGQQFTPNLCYSVVDMSLAAGMGSVTTKNVLLSGGLTEKLCGTRHCNGTDFWVVTRSNNNGFYAYQVSSTGVNTLAVASYTGTVQTGVLGNMRISPNGKKIASAVGNTGFFELFDFDNSTGLVSNPAMLLNNVLFGYGVEFSPDGSKLYGMTRLNGGLYQWDLCAGTNSAIAASIYTVATVTSGGGLQLAPNGKIYVCTGGTVGLSVINNPDLPGALCNYVYLGQALNLNTNTTLGLPNLITRVYRSQPPQFTYTVNSLVSCNTASFTSPPTPTSFGCAASGYSLINRAWNFGDPGSGPNNISAIPNPSHTYASQGTYTAQLVLYYSCGGGTDTITQVVNVNQPCISVNSTSITCASLGSATVSPTGGAGPFSYTWTPSNQTSSVATGLSPGTYTIRVFDSGNNVTYTTTTLFTSLIPLTGTLYNTPSITCNGANTGTGTVTNLAGGSGNQSYLWTNGSLSYTTASTSSLSAGLWSVNVTDALTGCQINQTFFISQPTPLNLNLSSNSSSVCLGGSIVLTGTNSGGNPGYTYTWTNSPASNTVSVAETIAGTYVYTLSSSDANTCLTSKTIAVAFVPNPTLSVNDVSICPLKLATLTVSGASTYTWASPSSVQASTTPSLTDSPTVTSQYTVLGSALGCTSIATASIVLHPLPVPVFNSNSPVCENTTFQFNASGGTSYYFTGPTAFTSSQQINTISPVSLADAGVYNVTVTSVDGCTATTSSSLTVSPIPTVSVAGSTVCTSQTLILNSNSIPGAAFLWSGPLGFASNLQSPTISNPSVTSSGTYSVKVTSVLGCTNFATALASVVPPPSLTVALTSNSLCYQAFNGSPNTITLSAVGANTYTLFTPSVLNPSGQVGPTNSFSSTPPYSASITVATATLIGSNGVCTSSITSTFSIIPNPTVIINSYTPVICAGQNFTYTSSGATSYTWGPNASGQTTYSSPVTVAHPTVTSIYSVFGGSIGCNSPTQTSTLTVYPLPVINLSPNSPTICLNNKVILFAGGTGTSFLWSPTTGLNDMVGPGVTASPTVTQTYTVIASANNCTNSAKITVSVMPLPQPTITSSKEKICLNEILTLSGSGGISYDWRIPGEAFYKGNEISFKVGSMQLAGEYSLTVTDEKGCKNSITKLITVHALPNGNLLGYKEEGCAPLCSKYDFVGANTSSVITTSWLIDKQVYSQKPFSYCFSQPGAYTMTAIVYDAFTTCTNRIDFPVLVHPKPEADFIYSPLKPIENLDEVIFTNTSTGEEQNKWTWIFNDNKGFKTSTQNTSYFYTDAGVYPVAMIVSNKWGCADTVMKSIQIEADFSIYVPNVFTPNGDGLNDIFLPIVRSAKLYELKIYDRWGTEVFHSNSPEDGWDGTFKAEICKQDCYIWKILLSTLNGEAKELVGNVTLLRAE